ncbi:hypothetical protein GCM10027261_04780 [Geodermatophilus arenarius]|uniref:Transposase n=1 Tax=Geodermatophilus arenarius TaxID=1137990 RepID=A0ABV9LEF0_9ACTN
MNGYRRSGAGFPGISTAPVVHEEQQEIRQPLVDRAQSEGVIDPARSAVANWRRVRTGEPLAP